MNAKRWGVYGLLVVLFSFSVTGLSCPADPTDSDTFPGSVYGRGGVTINDYTFMCGAADSVCPEYFQDAMTGDRASCAACPDPDCPASIYGYVTDNTSGVPIAGANVSIFFSSPAQSNLSDLTGKYALAVSSGDLVIAASKPGYDTVVKNINIPVEALFGPVEVNFSLPEGVCHADCTNELNRCNPACQGLTFADPGGGAPDQCIFFNNQITWACANKLAGTEVYLSDYNETHSWFARCCEGVPYTKYHPRARASCADGEHFVKVHRYVRLQGRPIKLVVAVCE